MAGPTTYYGLPLPTGEGISIARQCIIHAASGVLSALLGYLGDLLPWAPFRHTILIGVLTIRVVNYIGTESFSTSPEVLLPVLFATLTIAVEYCWHMKFVLTLFWSLCIYSEHLLALAAWAILLDGPVEETGLNLIESGISMLAHFLTAATLFQWKTICRHAFANIWSCDILSLVLLQSIFLLEFASELGNRWWFSTRISLETMYESFAAVRETWTIVDFKYFEYRSRLFYLLRTIWRQYFESRAETNISVEQPPDFAYSTEPLQDGEIRLLIINRRSLNPFADGLLHVRLVRVPLEEGEVCARALKYEALSYTWEPKNPQRLILVNGMRHYIGNNLYQLLHARHSFLYDRFIWVDALCINQANKQEKTVQIKRMRDIYIKANRVIAWVGEDFDTAMAARTLLEVSYMIILLRARPDWILSFWDRRSPQWKAFVKIFQKPYFARAWILQETALGFNLQFYIGGNYIVPDRVFYALVAIMQPEVLSSICVDSGMTQHDDLDGIKNWFQAFFLRPSNSEKRHDENAVQSLGLILSWSSRLQTTDPLDKVYAVLGVSNSSVAKSIEPTESISTTALFHSTAQKLLLSPEDAEFVFPHAGIRVPNAKPDLPTWAPDWEHELTRKSELLSRHFMPGMRKVHEMIESSAELDISILHDSKYAAGGHESRPTFQLDPSGMKLHTTAVLIDSVQQLSAVYDHTSLSVVHHLAWLQQAHTFGELVRDEVVLARTLIADRSNETQDFRGGDAETLLKAYHSFRDNFPMAELSTLRFATLRNILDPAAQAEATAREAVIMLGMSYAGQFKTACGGRKLCITARGRLAVVPSTTETKDVFSIIPGMQTPYVLRPPIDSQGHREYRLVGECYLDGAMENTEIAFKDAHGIVII